MLLPLQILVLPVIALHLLLSLLPLKTLYAGTSAAKRIGLSLFGREIKRKPRERIATAFPDLDKSEVETHVNEHFKRMSWFAAEFIKDLSPFSFRAAMASEVDNEPVFLDTVRKSKVTICFCAHCYNYENLTGILSRYGDCDFYLVYESVKFYPLMEWMICRKRSHSGGNVHLIPASAALQIFNLVKFYSESDGEPRMVLGIVADISQSASKESVDFLGRKRNIVVGPERIGRRFGASFLYVSSETLKRGHIRYRFHPLDTDYSADLYSVMRAFYAHLESDIRRSPADWMFWNE